MIFLELKLGDGFGLFGGGYFAIVMPWKDFGKFSCTWLDLVVWGRFIFRERYR